MAKLAKVECGFKKPENLVEGQPFDAQLEIKWSMSDGQDLSAIVIFEQQTDTKFKVQVDKENDTFVLYGMTDGCLAGQSRHAQTAGAHDLFEIRKTTSQDIVTTQWGSDGDNIIDGAITNANNGLYFGRVWGNMEGGQRMEGKDPAEADLFLTQITPDGQAKSVQFGTDGHDAIQQLFIDPSGHLILRGSTTGAFPNCQHHGGPDDNDCFLALIDKNGHLMVLQFGSDGDDEIEAGMMDSKNNIFLLGRTRGKFPGCIRWAKEEDDWDLMMIVVLLGQQRITALQWGSDGSDMIRAAMLNPHNGTVVVAGHTSGAFPGCSRQAQNDDDCDLFVSQITPDCQIKSYQWDTTGSRRIAELKLSEEKSIQVTTEDKMVKEIKQEDLKDQQKQKNAGQN